MCCAMRVELCTFEYHVNGFLCVATDEIQWLKYNGINQRRKIRKYADDVDDDRFKKQNEPEKKMQSTQNLLR